MPQSTGRKGKAVLVNQRALINKVLARYPSEFTVFRELLQNSDDAKSSTVEIHFKTAASSGRLSEIVQWTFKNDGDLFGEKDWERLTQIALGNPDVRKVGAFGVGFYSVFSVTDRPIVSSNIDPKNYGAGIAPAGKRRVMEFYFDENQLCFEEKDTEREDWTVFQIPLRTPAPMPGIIELMRFLATSITFMVHLRHVKLFLDDHRFGYVQKSEASHEAFKFPIELTHHHPLDMRIANGLQRQRFTIQVEISKKVSDFITRNSLASNTGRNAHYFSLGLEDSLTHVYTKKLDMVIFCVEVDINLSTELSNGLVRCMSKAPPPRVQYYLVYTGKDEYDRSSSGYEHQSLVSIFQDLRVDFSQPSHSKIFIGQATSESTGFGGHMASQFIPTVERGLIDLADTHVATWNNALLYIGGLLSRLVYELELSDIKTTWVTSTKGSHPGPPPERRLQLQERFIHVLNFFTFHPSTPSPKIAKQLRSAFYSCSPSSPKFLSSVGVRSASEIRSVDSFCSRFLKRVPILLPDVIRSGTDFIKALPEEHQMQVITVNDILEDLRADILREAELIAYLQWQMNQEASFSILFREAHFRDVRGTSISLSSIQYFIDSNGLGAHIPSDGPFPPSLLPRQVAKQFAPAHLVKFRWREFTVADWLHHISKPEVRSAHPEYDFTRTAGWAESVLHSVSTTWPSSSDIPDSVKLVFANEACIPTTRGLCKPTDSYLPHSIAHAFNDAEFPIVQLPSKPVITKAMERFLKDLGVKQHLPPQLLIRMVTEGKWRTSELIAHLAPVVDTLKDTDIEYMNSLEAFEGVQIGTSKTRFRIKELYTPIDSFRQLHLPLINLGEERKWDDSSSEAKVLYRLGLQRFPPLGVIVSLCLDSTVGADAFNYLCTNLRSTYSGCTFDDFRNEAFIPAVNNDGACLEKPGSMFLDKQWKILGFSVPRTEHQDKFLEELGVQHHPSSSLLMERLKTNPPSKEWLAERWFELLSKHVSRFSEDELKDLSREAIIPKSISEGTPLLTPVQCYLEKKTKLDLYPKLFHFVSFGPGACRFLRACGAKDEPSDEDVAKCLIDDPQRFYNDCAGSKRFLDELRDLAARRDRISNDTIGKMRMKPVLLGLRRKQTANSDGWEDEYVLCEPRTIVIVDDEQIFQLFAGTLTAAPRDLSPELEDFYVLLGCQRLTRVVQDRPNPSHEKEDPEMSNEFRDLVAKGLPLFLHYYPHPKPGPSGFQLSDRNDINIRVFEELSISHTLTIGDKNTEVRAMSATAIYERGTIQLWLTDRAKEDKFELAVSLCRILLGTENRRDAELLSTCLSGNQGVFKRRGYLIDQVHLCGRCRQDWGSVSAAYLSNSTAPGASSVSTNEPTERLVKTKANPDCVPEPHHPITSPDRLDGANGAMPGSFFQNGMCEITPTNIPSIETVMHTWRPMDSRQVMPRHHIKSTVEQSTNRYQTQPQRCSDSSKAKFLGHCDTSQSVENLQHVGRVENMEVYVDRGIADKDSTFKERKKKPLTDFIHLITSIAEIYNYSTESLCVFYGTSSGCIAFNYQGTLYLNFRYFIVWHYQHIRKGDKRGALSSWFFTLAHEIAHNLIQDHNSEHEFWFSAICEAHMDKFMKLLE